MVGKVVERAGKELTDLLQDDLLFDIGSHTYSHMRILSDHSEVLQQLDQELVRTSELILKYFGKEPLGFCAPEGFTGECKVTRSNSAFYGTTDTDLFVLTVSGRLSNRCQLFLPSHIGISRMDSPSCLKCQLMDGIVTYFSIQAIRMTDGNQHPVLLMERF